MKLDLPSLPQAHQADTKFRLPYFLTALERFGRRVSPHWYQKSRIPTAPKMLRFCDLFLFQTCFCPLVSLELSDQAGLEYIGLSVSVWRGSLNTWIGEVTFGCEKCWECNGCETNPRLPMPSLQLSFANFVNSVKNKSNAAFSAPQLESATFGTNERLLTVKNTRENLQKVWKSEFRGSATV